MLNERRVLFTIAFSVLVLFFVLIATGCAPASFTGPNASTPDPVVVVKDPVVATRPALPSECPTGGVDVVLDAKVAVTVCNVLAPSNCDSNEDEEHHGNSGHGNNGSDHDNH